MAKVIVPADVHPQQVDFPKDVSARESSLHIRPASSCEMTEAEVAWLLKSKQHRALVSKLIFAKASDAQNETLADKLRRRGIVADAEPAQEAPAVVPEQVKAPKAAKPAPASEGKKS